MGKAFCVVTERIFNDDQEAEVDEVLEIIGKDVFLCRCRRLNGATIAVPSKSFHLLVRPPLFSGPSVSNSLKRLMFMYLESPKAKNKEKLLKLIVRKLARFDSFSSSRHIHEKKENVLRLIEDRVKTGKWYCDNAEISFLKNFYDLAKSVEISSDPSFSVKAVAKKTCADISYLVKLVCFLYQLR